MILEFRKFSSAERERAGLDKRDMLEKLGRAALSALPTSVVLDVPGVSVSSGGFSEEENRIFRECGMGYDPTNFVWKAEGDPFQLGQLVHALAQKFGGAAGEDILYEQRKDEFLARELVFSVLEVPAGEMGGLDLAAMDV